jgi:pimeloyl-ACP methyl ester carboxylesterase
MITEQVKLDDITMYYAAYGEGEPLILLHNAMADSDIWTRQVPVFAQRYRVITPDLRGQGRTTDGEDAWNYDLVATDVLRLMDYLKIDKAHIVGWNLGAITGLELASRHPERVRALVVYGAYTNPEGLKGSVLNWFRTASLTQLQADMDYKYTKVSPTPDHLPVMLEKMRDLFLSQPNITPDELAGIKPPTLILDTEFEDLLRIDHVKAMAAAMPQAEFTLIPGTGHLAPRDRPAEFNKIVLDFLKDK